VEAVIALVICDRTACKRAKETIHLSVIITLLLQRSLHISNYLIWRKTIIRVDRTIPGIIRIGSVAPRREPVTGAKVIWGSERPHDVIAVMAMPPTLIVPLCGEVADNSVLFALPVLTSLNVFALLALHSSCLGGGRLFCNVEVLRLKW